MTTSDCGNFLAESIRSATDIALEPHPDAVGAPIAACRGAHGPEARGAEDSTVSDTERDPSSTGRSSAAAVLRSIVAAFLVLLVGVALIGAVAATIELLLRHDYAKATVGGLDAAFLAIILLELVSTTLSRGPVTRQVQEFPRCRTTLAVSMAISAAAVLVLVAALWLVRQRVHAERNHPQANGN